MGEDAGKFTFNRGVIPIKLEWWPEIYTHSTAKDLVEYISENMPKF